MNDALDAPQDAATPLDEEEKNALIPSYITHRHELNAAEQANILQAREWAYARPRDVLDARFLDSLHKRMFENVWRWAGTHRRSAKSVGIDAYQVSTALQQMINDCRYWIEQGTYPADEIAARFHHRLVWIHPYPNGNGRHARLATDLLLRALDEQPFSWGQQSLVDESATRQRYVTALRAADRHDFGPLLAFVRS